ncbi:hypothetical protein [Novosphingobium sp. BL-52-GroH]|uniref:hypothetical protein n=1 Tax=Novosphingobium sp. BL-52-GroH TaxID=3349877 RepID=UPI00384BC193
MSVLFTLIFIAAVVGIFKPYINGWKRWHFGIAAFVAFILIGIAGMQSTGEKLKKTFEAQEATKTGSGKTSSGESTSAAAETTVPAEPESAWSYSEDKDEMRGGTTYYASLRASNTLSLGFPYGDQDGKVLVRQSPQFGFDILVGVDSGQVLCNSFSDSYVNVKFDDGPIRRYSCTDASDGTNNMVFIQGAKGFLSNLKKSKKMVVEAEFYQNGMQQMIFDTAGLKWSH